MQTKRQLIGGKKFIFFCLVLIIAAFINVSSAFAICGDKIKDSGEECDFDPEIGPYPNQCPNNGACDWETCKCEICVPNCACATNLCSNSNCSNGCGSTCTGQKVCTDGECGSADGKFTVTIPTTNLCSSGTASAVTGDGPWSWTCVGVNGGKEAKCETGKKGDTHYHYVPAYFDDAQYYYCSDKSSIDGVAGKKDVYPCDSNNNKFGKHYQYSKSYYGGFREKFNPNDPIIAYRTDELSGEEEEMSYTSFSLQMQNPMHPNGNKENPKIFNSVTGEALDSRLYFPPGLMGLSLRIQPTQFGGWQTIIGRFGHPPVADFPPGSSKDEWSAYMQNYTQYPQYFPPEVYSSGKIYNDVGNVKLNDYKKYDLLTFQEAGFDNVAWKPFNVGYDGQLDYEDIAKEGGWLYLKFKEWGASQPLGYLGWWVVDLDTYTTWYNCMNEKNGWDSNSDPKEGFTACDPSAIPTGSDCASKTCVGNSCDSGSTTAENPWIPGTKTEGCATGTVKADPDRLLVPGNSFITWSSEDASEVEVACSGNFPLARGIWYLSGEECYADGKYCELNGTEKGYKLTFDEKYFQAEQKQETCTFYPTNESDGRPGTPFSFTVNFGEEEDGEGERTNSGYVCQPDDPSCAKSTCKDVKCFDGCKYLQGTKDCKGRE